MTPPRVTGTLEILPGSRNDCAHLVPSEAASNESLSTTRTGFDLGHPNTLSEALGLASPANSRPSPAGSVISHAGSGVSPAGPSASHTGPSEPISGTDNWDGGVLLPEAINYDSNPKPTNSSVTPSSETGESVKTSLPAGKIETFGSYLCQLPNLFLHDHSGKLINHSANNLAKPSPANKENAHLPPHLRWTGKEKGAQSSKTLASKESAPGNSRLGSHTKATEERVSLTHQSPAETSRIKEQARLADRTGVAKAKALKAEEIEVAKYEGYDTRNATLAKAKVDKPFPCPITDCPAGYLTKSELHRHQDDRHQYCTKCKTWFENMYMLHIHKVEDSSHVVCQICSVDFWTNEALEGHVKQVSLPT